MSLRTCLENVVGQASRLPLGGLSPVFSRARRPFIAGRRPAPLFFKHALNSKRLRSPEERRPDRDRRAVVSLPFTVCLVQGRWSALVCLVWMLCSLPPTAQE